MIGYTYILKCNDESYYTGSTKDIDVRLWQHQNGEGANYTKKRLPVELVYLEEFAQIDEAFFREKQIQGWSRKKKEALISNDFKSLPELSRNKQLAVADSVEALEEELGLPSRLRSMSGNYTQYP